jgi:hypothetical protein
MQIILPPELEEIVQNYLHSGKYQTAAEVLLAGVKLLQQEEAPTNMTFGILDKQSQYIVLTESEMIQESLKVLESHGNNSIPQSQVETWVDTLAKESGITND